MSKLKVQTRGPIAAKRMFASGFMSGVFSGAAILITSFNSGWLHAVFR